MVGKYLSILLKKKNQPQDGMKKNSNSSLKTFLIVNWHLSEVNDINCLKNVNFISAVKFPRWKSRLYFIKIYTL